MASSTTIPDLWGFFIVLVISLVSGFVSISKRILHGAEVTLLWVITEFMTAILCGYLMYNAYPAIAGYLPEWLTLPVAVAVAAHSGGRIFQECEAIFLEHYTKLINRPR